MNTQFFRTLWKPTILFTLLMLLVLLATAAPTATDAAPKQTYYITAAYPNFTGATAFTLNSDAVITGGLIRLTRNATNLWGSAFRTQRVTLPANFAFSTQFKFRMHSGSPNTADGLAFCIQTAGNNAGTSGGGLGYGGVSPSLCVEFDTYQNTERNDPSGNHVGVMVNGNTAHNTGSSGPGWTNSTTLGCPAPWGGGGGNTFDNGSVYVASIDYDGTNVSVRLDCDYSRAGSILFGSHAVNLASIFSSRNVYIGFTAATGAQFQQHEIHSLYFQNGCCAAPTPPVDVDAYNYLNGAATVTASASPTTIPTGGSATITCNAKDETGNNLANQVIDISTTFGTLSATSGTTNASGNVSVTLTGPSTAGTATVTCTARTGPYSDPSATVNVVLASTTTLTSSRNPAVVGAPVTFTCAVSGSGATPTGTVSLYAGTTLLGSGSLTNGQRTFTTSTLPIGSHAMRCDYGGSGSYYASSANLTQQVTLPTWFLGPTRGMAYGNPATFGRLTATGAGDGCVLWVAQYVGNPVPGGGAPTYNFHPDWFYDVRQENCTSVQLSFNGPPSGGRAFWWSGTEWLMASNQNGALIVNITNITSPNLTQLFNGDVFGITNGVPEVPEASTLLLLGGGLGGAATWLRYQWSRRKKA